MENGRIDAIGHQIKGMLKEGLGKIIGDAKLQADGAAERAAGHTQDGTPFQVAGIDADRIRGVGRQFSGAMKQGFGGLTGNATMAAEGNAEREAGKAQNEAGSVRDEARDASNDQHPGKDGQ